MKVPTAGAAAVLVAGAIALIGAVPQGVAAPAGTLTVHRAETVDVIRFTGGANREVEVVRGPAIVPSVARAAMAEARVPERFAMAGHRVWLIDRQRDRLTACYLRDSTQVGRRVIRCTSRRLPE